MEEYTMIVQAIGTVGFPIVMCLILMWYIYQTNKQHKEETEKLTTALNNNTTAIIELKNKFSKE